MLAGWHTHKHTEGWGNDPATYQPSWDERVGSQDHPIFSLVRSATPIAQIIHFPTMPGLLGSSGCLCGEGRYNLRFPPLLTAIIQMCDFLASLIHSCTIFPSPFLSPSLCLSLYRLLLPFILNPFFPLCLVIEWEIPRLCDSPLLSDIKQGGFVDYQGKLIMTW